MALEWVILAYAAGAEAILILFVTMPGLDSLRKGITTVARNSLKPLLTVVPFGLFLLLDIYWKLENLPKCESETCEPTELARHAKSIMKSQRNALLVIAVLLLYWILFSATRLVVQLERLNQQVKSLKERKSD